MLTIINLNDPLLLNNILFIIETFKNEDENTFFFNFIICSFLTTVNGGEDLFCCLLVNFLTSF